MKTPALLAAAAAAALIPLAASQSVWTVDVDPMAGADFVTIQAAVDAAAAGDTILVGPGDYDGFDLHKGLTIIGSRGLNPYGVEAVLTRVVQGAASSNSAVLSQVPSDETAALADLSLRFGCIGQQNQGRLILDRCGGSMLRLRDNFDCRVRTYRPRTALEGSHTWVELSEAAGTVFVDTGTVPAAPPNVLISNPDLQGTDAYGYWSCMSTQFYDSFPAMTADRAHLVIIGRSTDRLIGGDLAYGSCIPLPGSPGLILDEGSLHLSGVTIASRDPSVTDIALGPAVQFTEPLTLDPTLRLEGEPEVGANVMLVVDGAPGDEARIELGRGPAYLPSPGSHVPRLVTPGRTHPIGPVLASGSASLSIQIPSSATPGTIYWFQAWTVTPTGQGRRTNSLPLVVRP